MIALAFKAVAAERIQLVSGITFRNHSIKKLFILVYSSLQAFRTGLSDLNNLTYYLTTFLYDWFHLKCMCPHSILAQVHNLIHFNLMVMLLTSWGFSNVKTNLRFLLWLNISNAYNMDYFFVCCIRGIQCGIKFYFVCFDVIIIVSVLP